ncbi:MAG TPA: nucleotidyltransferase family protein [Candidatus Binatia bacterium]|jgi:molybdenum cofactor cytidylyltransferase
MIAAVVLSAGESSRMGRPKALLPIGKLSFLERIVKSLRATKVEKIIVVLGHNAEEMKNKIRHLPVTITINRDYAQGQLSSLAVGIRALQAENVDGLLLHLVDHPYLNPDLVDRMIERFYESKKLIVVPVWKGRRGHPVIFSRRLFGELSSAPLAEGAKSVVHAHADETLEVETDDERITFDIDTPEEYRRYVGRDDGET